MPWLHELLFICLDKNKNENENIEKTYLCSTLCDWIKFRKTFLNVNGMATGKYLHVRKLLIQYRLFEESDTSTMHVTSQEINLHDIDDFEYAFHTINSILSIAFNSIFQYSKSRIAHQVYPHLMFITIKQKE